MLVMERARASVVILAALVGICLPLVAQDATAAQERSTSGLRLELLRTHSGSASIERDDLTIRFFNAGAVTITMPEPMVLCADTLGGFVMVYRRVLSRSRYPETGRGCVADRMARLDVVTGPKTWRKLAPREVYSITVPLKRAVTLNPDGRYEIRAKYYPPPFTPTELSTLAAQGIVVVQHTIESPPLIMEPQE